MSSGAGPLWARLHGNPLASTAEDQPMQTSTIALLQGVAIPLQPNARQKIELQGTPGAVSTTLIAPGAQDGQELWLIGLSNANTVTLLTGGNMEINGPMTLGLDDVAYFVWKASNVKWVGVSREIGNN